MCTAECFRWVGQRVRRGDVENKRILEVGSYDVNGSLRYVFEMLEPAEYIGTDIEKGPCVDVVCGAENLVSHFGENSFDIVVSASALEHIRDWRTSISNIKRVCRPGGLIFFLVPFQWVYHAHPGDYWRYSPEDIRTIFSEFTIENIEVDPHPPSLVYARLRKPLGDFKEVDLSNVALHSMVSGTRVIDISDKDFQSAHFRKTVLKYKMKNLGLKLGKRIFRQL